MTQDASADHPTILVADVDGLLRFMASDVLLAPVYRRRSDSAEEAIKVMEARKDVRLLFTDIQMPPGCDGLELAREVHNRWPKVRVLSSHRGRFSQLALRLPTMAASSENRIGPKTSLVRSTPTSKNKEKTELQGRLLEK